MEKEATMKPIIKHRTSKPGSARTSRLKCELANMGVVYLLVVATFFLVYVPVRSKLEMSPPDVEVRGEVELVMGQTGW